MAVLYYLPTYKTTTLATSGGIDDSQTTDIELTNVTGLDIAKPGIICVTYATPLVTTSYELITYTSIDGSNKLVGATRGAEGSTARSHSNLAVIGFVISKAHFNNINDKLTSNDEDLVVDPNGNELIKTSYVASAVNEWDFSNSATGTPVLASAEGGDTDIDINLIPKGAGEVKYRKSVVIPVEDYATNLSTGNGKAWFTVPEQLDGMNLSAVHARVITAPTDAAISIQVYNLTDTTDMLSTAITIDATEFGSDTAAAPAVIDAAEDDVATNDVIQIDIDQVGSTLPGAGLVVRLEFDLP